MNFEPIQPASDHISGQQNILPDGIAIFSFVSGSTGAPSHPSNIQVIIQDKHIEQTGVAPRENDQFSFQIVLNSEGKIRLAQWKALPSSPALFLSVNGTTVSHSPLTQLDADTIEQPGLTFDTVYRLAETLAYDKKALDGLAKLAPAGRLLNPEKSLNQSWKVVGKNAEFLGDYIDEIEDILSNRLNVMFNHDVSIQRLKTSLFISTPPNINQDILKKLVSTCGQVNIFSSRSFVRKGEAIPEQAVEVLNQGHINSANLDNMSEITLGLEINGEGSDSLIQFRGKFPADALYLGIDGIVASERHWFINGDSHLEMPNLSEDEAVFLYSILDNDTLPFVLDVVPGLPVENDESFVTWKIQPNIEQPPAEVMDEIFEILTNRVEMVYRQRVSIRRAQNSLRAICPVEEDSNVLIHLLSVIGKINIFRSNEVFQIGQTVPHMKDRVLDESCIASASIDKQKHNELSIELTADGVNFLSNISPEGHSSPLHLGIDGRIALERPLKIDEEHRLVCEGLTEGEALFLMAILDNNILPVGLSLSPINVSRAESTSLRGFSGLWMVKQVGDSTLSVDEWEDVRLVLENRFKTMFRDATSVEYEGGRLTIIPDMQTDIGDLETLVSLMGEVSIFQSPFNPEIKEALPHSAKIILTQEEITGLSLQFEEHEAACQIKLDTQGLDVVRQFFTVNHSLKLYLAIDGKVISSTPLEYRKDREGLVMDNMSLHDARFLAAILDNDMLPAPLCLQPISMEEDSLFTPENNQVWYVESALDSGPLSYQDVEITLSILNKRADELLNGLVSFERDEDWGILVQFTYPDTPINLDRLEQVVNKQGIIWVFTSTTVPLMGNTIHSTSSVVFTQEEIHEIKIDRSIYPMMVRFILNTSGKKALSKVKNSPLYLAVDHEVFSTVPLTLISDDELGLEGLKEEEASLIMSYFYGGLLPGPIQVNMEEIEE